MKRWLAVFELPVAEQRVLIALLVMTVAFAVAKSRTDERDRETAVTAELSAQPSPSPGILP